MRGSKKLAVVLAGLAGIVVVGLLLWVFWNWFTHSAWRWMSRNPFKLILVGIGAVVVGFFADGEEGASIVGWGAGVAGVAAVLIGIFGFDMSLSYGGWTLFLFVFDLAAVCLAAGSIVSRL